MTPVGGAMGLAWRARQPLALGVTAAVVLAWMATGVLLAPLGAVGPAPGPLQPAAPIGEVAGIPAVYLPVYQAAADRYRVSWALLAAIHRKESDFSRLRASSSVGDAVSAGWNGCGAAGPAQLGVVGVPPYRATVTGCPGSPRSGAGGTWARYRDVARGLPRPVEYPQMAGRLLACRDTAPHGCVYDDVDALAAAAAYLRDLGAGSELDARAWSAARAYNGAAIYADVVLAWAREYAAAATTFTQPPASPLLDSVGPVVAGARAQLRADGRAAAPAEAPAAVRAAIAAANAISDRPYRLVHYPTHLNNPTYDCSSATSHVLWASGAFGTRPQVSGELMRYGQPGPGRWVTVYANTGHAYIVIAGLRFDTADYNAAGSPTAGQGGPRWRLGPRPSTNFIVRHPPGL